MTVSDVVDTAEVGDGSVCGLVPAVACCSFSSFRRNLSLLGLFRLLNKRFDFTLGTFPPVRSTKNLLELVSGGDGVVVDCSSVGSMSLCSVTVSSFSSAALSCASGCRPNLKEDFVLREKSSFGLKLKLSPLMGKLGKFLLGVTTIGVSVLISSLLTVVVLGEGSVVNGVVVSSKEPIKILLETVELGLKND